MPVAPLVFISGVFFCAKESRPSFKLKPKLKLKLKRPCATSTSLHHKRAPQSRSLVSLRLEFPPDHQMHSRDLTHEIGFAQRIHFLGFS